MSAAKLLIRLLEAYPPHMGGLLPAEAETSYKNKSIPVFRYQAGSSSSSHPVAMQYNLWGILGKGGTFKMAIYKKFLLCLICKISRRN